MSVLSIDVETYSSVNLKECGAHKYVESPDFEVLLFAYSIDYGPVSVVDIVSGEQIPADVLTMLTDPSVEKTAYNAAFERACLARHLGKPMPAEQWQCTMVLAGTAGLPMGLEATGKALGLPPDKQKKDGTALIRYFCTPCKATISNGGRTRNMPTDNPVKWQRFKEYNQRDVETENEIRKMILPFKPRGAERDFWVLDQKINDRGVRLDLELAENAVDFANIYTDKLVQKAVKLTGIQNVKSVSQIKEWLEQTEGFEVESLNKKSMPDVIAKLQTSEAKEFLDLRTEFSKTSVTKYKAMLRCACADDHARGLFQFYGATRTGRFAGRLIQLQNLPQNHLEGIASARALVKAGLYQESELIYENINSLLSELIRTALVPEPGCRFLVADFSAIEARVIAWYAGEQDDLDEFRGKGKIYERTASKMFGVPMDRIKKGNPEYALRAKGKVATLACGYQGGPNAMIAMGALRSGISEEELPALVQQWRSSHTAIVRWWKSLELAAIQAIRTKSKAKDRQGGVVFDYRDGDLLMYLRSGRPLVYQKARLVDRQFGSPNIQYHGQDQKTKQYRLLDTYGGKLAENCVQATARDVLRDTMLRLDALGFDIRIHVHDEVIVNEPNDSGRTLDDIIRVMRTPPDWAPDLPLNAAGFETQFYMKD